MTAGSGDTNAIDKIDLSTLTGVTIGMPSTGATGATGSYGVYPGTVPGYYTVPNTTGAGIGGMSYYTIPNTSSPSVSWSTTTSPVTSIHSPLVIEYGGTKIDVGQAITMLMERLCIIQPSFELHEKYPALKEAYEAYKSLEALCKSGDKDEQ